MATYESCICCLSDILSHSTRKQFSFRPGVAQTGLYSHRWLESYLDSGKCRVCACTIFEVKTVVLIGHCVCALIYFACTKGSFHMTGHMISEEDNKLIILIPCAAAIIVLIVFLVGLYIYCKRKKTRKRQQPEQNGKQLLFFS